MRITIEIDSECEMDKLSALFEKFEFNKVNIIAANELSIPIIKGDKQIDPSSLFGIWAKSPRTLESIRKGAWQRKNEGD